jgi:hypothetical protein
LRRLLGRRRRRRWGRSFGLGFGLGLGDLLRGGLWLGGAKLGDRRRVGRPERGDRRDRSAPGRLGGRPPRRFATESGREAVLGLQNATVLFCERVRERWTGDETALDDDLAQASPRARLLFEGLRELLLGEQSGCDQDSAELRCWNLCRVHDSSIGWALGFVRESWAIRSARETRPVLLAELRRLSTWEERHRRLIARLAIALAVTVVIDAIGAILVWYFEHGVKNGDIHGFGDAVFFSTVQLLTVSSQIKNPLTAGGRVVDIFLEVWALFVVTSVAGSFAAFFGSADP